MLAVALVTGLTLGWLRLLGWFYHRATVHQQVPPDPGAGCPLPGREPVDDLDDDRFPARLGVSAATYRRYVEAGMADLDAFLEARRLT